MAVQDDAYNWTFANNPGNGYGQGVNNAVASHFDKNIYSSLIRESIQNSLDAVDDERQPVVVKFNFNRLQASEYPRFFELQDHISGIAEQFPNNTTAREMTDKMLSVFTAIGRNQRLDYIQVSDYNTVGMDYINGKSCPFSAFLRSAGDSVKENLGSGGSFGFGKAAYFEMSPIKTVLVSTRTKSNKYFFEGSAILTTHKFKGEEKIHVGYYDTENGYSPTSNFDKILPRFRRKEQGSDVCIMGVSASEKEKADAYKQMTLSVLRNFWLAILHNKLIVYIGETTIDANNLAESMCINFPDDTDETNRSEIYNPRPYFEAVKYAGLNSKYVCINKDLPSLGKVSLFIKKVKNAKDKIAYMRSLRMLVYSKQFSTSYGCYGLFFCDNKRGNEILRKLENAAHKEWDISNWKTDNRNLGKNVLNEIRDFISETLENLFSTEENSPVGVSGLEEFLFIPEDLIPKEDEDINENPFFGKESGKFDNEGFSMSSVIDDSKHRTNVSDEASPSNAIVVELKQTTAIPDESGDLGASNSGKKTKRHSSTHAPGNLPHTETEGSEEGTFTRNVPVTYRVIATRNLQGQIEHNLIIYAKQEVLNGFIQIGISGEQEDEILDIIFADKGIPDHNVLNNIHLMPGKNNIKIRLEDNMKHSILLKAYEVK